MALIESLKAFYKDNVENVDKLNDADSILEVLRAKYGNYKGSNIEEYFKELVNNGISPGGGGGGDFKVFKVTINADPEVVGSQYYVTVDSNDDSNYAGVFALENGFNYLSPYVGGPEESNSIVVDLICFGDSVTNVFLPSALTASSGAIEYDEETSHYIISGDCSVTGCLDD